MLRPCDFLRDRDLKSAWLDRLHRGKCLVEGCYRGVEISNPLLRHRYTKQSPDFWLKNGYQPCSLKCPVYIAGKGRPGLLDRRDETWIRHLTRGGARNWHQDEFIPA